MARSCATYEKEFTAVLADETAATDHPGGLSATLKKGLPAIVRIVLTILECPARRGYTWRERVAALEAITSLSALPALLESQGPLGEYRLRLIQGCVRGKHNSVAAVREVATQTLIALEANETETSQKRSCVVGSWESSGGSAWGKDTGLSVAEMRRSYHTRERGIPKEKPRKKKKTLEVLVNRAAWKKEKDELSEEKRAVEHSCSTKRREGGEHHRPRLERDERVLSPEGLASLSSVASSVEGSREYRGESVGETKNEAKSSARQSFAWAFPEENRNENDEQKTVRRPSGIPASRTRDEIPCAPPPEWNAERETRATPLDANMERKTDDSREATPLEPTDARNPSVPTTMLMSQPLQHLSLPMTTAAVATSARHKSEGILNQIAPVGTGGVPSLPPPRDGGTQVDTVRLLRHLSDKSDSIASALSTLDQRLVGMEKSLVVSEFSLFVCGV